jgi:hypothetical protein
MYNSVKDIHIDIEILYQKINSNRKRFFQPEEIDRVFNLTMLEFIKTRSNPITNIKRQGREQSVKRTEDLRELKKRKLIPTYYLSADLMYFTLPADYGSFTDCKPAIFYNCDNDDLSTKTTSFSKCIIEFPDDTIASSDFYKNFKIDVTDGITTTTLIDINDYVDFGTINSKSEKFELTQLFLSLAILKYNSELEIYWQYYDNEYHPNSFIIIDKGGVYTSATLSFDGVSNTANFNTIVKTIYDLTGKSLIDTNSELRPSEYIEDTKTNSIANRNRQNKILIEEEENRILLHHTNKFVIDSVQLRYDKKPILMNIRANIMPTLLNVADELVKLTVKKMVAIANGNYEVLNNENLTIE